MYYTREMVKIESRHVPKTQSLNGAIHSRVLVNVQSSLDKEYLPKQII